MPVQWTAENDRLFFLKLIETHGISLNYEKIAEAWPEDAVCRPTAKALSERYSKLRKLAGVSAPARSGKAALNTPSKPRATGRVVKPSKSSAKKRISVDGSELDALFTDAEPETPTHNGNFAFPGDGGQAGSTTSDLPDEKLMVKAFNAFAKYSTELRAQFNTTPFHRARVPNNSTTNNFGQDQSSLNRTVPGNSVTSNFDLDQSSYGVNDGAADLNMGFASNDVSDGQLPLARAGHNGFQIPSHAFQHEERSGEGVGQVSSGYRDHEGDFERFVQDGTDFQLFPDDNGPYYI